MADDRDHDEDAFAAHKQALVAVFEATSAGRDVGWVAEQALDLRWRFIDGDLATWTGDTVRELLLEVYPRRVDLRADELAAVPPGFAALLRFLGGEGLVDPIAAETAAALAVDLAGAFVDAMRDESRWGTSKRMVTAMAAEGVDLTDPAQLDRWVDQFNARPFEERDALLGPPQWTPSAQGVVPRLPAVALAPEAELIAAADRAVWVSQIRLMADYIGDGRPLTAKGNLRLADAKELVALLGTDDRPDPAYGDRTIRTSSSADLRGVDQPFRVAVSAGFLRRTKTKVEPGRNIAMLRGDSLGTVYGLLLCLLKTDGPSAYRWGDDGFGWGWYAESLDEQLTPLLIQLYCETTPTAIADLTEACWRVLEEEYDLSDLNDGDGPLGRRRTFHRHLVGSALSDAMLVLADIGVISTTAPTRAEARADRSFDDELDANPRADPFDKPPKGEVVLTALGTWAVNRFLASFTDAPTLGALVELDADDLLRAVADRGDEHAAAEIDTWVARRPDGAEQLVAAMRAADTTGRALAYRALLRVGPPAAATWEQVDAPELWAHAQLWRCDAGLATADEISADTDEHFVQLLGAVVDVWGAGVIAPWAERLAGPRGVMARIEAIWRLDGDVVGDVLGALGDQLPDKQLAKAARKALFRRRSRG